MSDPTQPPRDSEEQSPNSPFPESSLNPQEGPPPPVEPESEPATAPAPAPAPPPEPEHQWAAPAPPPAGGGMTSGDPLGDSTAPSYPPGYTTPPPPGAGGFSQAFAAPAPGTYRLGGWWARVGAQLIDGLIISVPAVIVLAVLGVGIAGSDTDDGAGALIGGFLLTLVVWVVVALLYAPLMMSRTNGQTVGRMAMGIRVIRASGEPMTFGFAALREIVVKGLLVGTVSSFTFGLASLLDVLWPLWDDENRALHDMVVNTRVVQA